MRARATARLARRSRLWVNLGAAGLWTSGVLWLVFHYFAVRAGEFGPERSPLEPWWLKIHGAFAFLALWLGGMLWGLHIKNGWRQRRRRASGGALLATLAVLIVTGYLLYYTGDDGPREVVSLIHWGIGLAAPTAYAAHRLLGRLRAPP